MEAKNPRSVVRQTVDRLLDIAAVVEALEGLIPESCKFSVTLDNVDVWPDSEQESRRIVGALIRKLGSKPTIRKWGTQLEAAFTYRGVPLRINRYRGRKCAMVKRTIVHEAEPERIIPAKEAYVEEVEELVCEMDDVEKEVTPAAEPAEV